MSETPAKLCCMCNKSVVGSKHIKDKRGRYYCVPCYQMAAERQQRQVASAASAGKKPAEDHERANAEHAEVAVESTPAPAALPEFCPNCGAKVIGNRKICFKCNRDVTKMDQLVARRAAAEAEEAKGPGGTQIFAAWFGRVSRVILTIVVVGVLIFVLWGIKLMFISGGLWDHYPTSRETAVRDFLQHISTGTDKSYTKAYKLVSWRESTTGDAGEDLRHKRVFATMHDDFVKKYGSDWYSKMKLEKLGSNEQYADDEVDFRLTLGKDTYIIATQVQIDITRAAANMALPKFKKPVYDEDGKNHFGILDVDKYKVRDNRRMVDMVGPGRPEKFDLPMPMPE